MKDTVEMKPAEFFRHLSEQFQAAHESVHAVYVALEELPIGAADVDNAVTVVADESLFREYREFMSECDRLSQDGERLGREPKEQAEDFARYAVAFDSDDYETAKKLRDYHRALVDYYVSKEAAREYLHKLRLSIAHPKTNE